MQEDIEQRCLTLVISANKLTVRLMVSAMSKYLAHLNQMKASKARTSPDVHPKGKQSVKKLVGQNQGVSNIEINEKNIRDFDRVARKYGVDYAVKKDRTTMPPKYLVFFKARDADALTAAFKEYTADSVRKQNRPSVIQKLRTILPRAVEQVREKKKELER